MSEAELPYCACCYGLNRGLAQGQIVRRNARCILQFMASAAVLVFLLAQQLVEIINRLLEPFAQLGLRLPIEQRLGLADIRAALLGVILRQQRPYRSLLWL